MNGTLESMLNDQLSIGPDFMFVKSIRQAVCCGAGNGSVVPASQTKQAAQPNGRAVAGQQWQPPQNPPGPFSAKPMPQDLPAIETVKMSSELRVSFFSLPQW